MEGLAADGAPGQRHLAGARGAGPVPARNERGVALPVEADGALVRSAGVRRCRRRRWRWRRRLGGLGGGPERS